MADPTQRALETHRNHYLFSDYYLDNRVMEQPDWQVGDPAAALAEIEDLWRGFKPHLLGAPPRPECRWRRQSRAGRVIPNSERESLG